MRPRRPRRRFRRLARGLFGAPGLAGPLAQPVLRELNRAHGLLGSGHYDEAADLFGQLADGAEERRMAKRAASLHAQAAEALIAAGEPAEAVERARRAMNLLALAGRPRRARRLAERIHEALLAKGYTSEADALFQGAPVSAGEPLPEAEPAPSRAALPGKCPHCGGAARSDDVEWIDEASAECAFCGGVIKTQG
jgi:hypothetical protein